MQSKYQMITMKVVANILGRVLKDTELFYRLKNTQESQELIDHYKLMLFVSSIQEHFTTFVTVVKSSKYFIFLM